MAYVPPHRSSAPPSDGPPSSGERGGGGRGYGAGGGSFGSSRSRDYGGSFSSSRGRDRDGGREINGSSEGAGGGTSMPRRPLDSKSARPEPVWPKWQPSERIKKLMDEQIAEVRQRLNVAVEIPAGSATCPAPVESFEDMSLHSNIMKDIVFHSYTNPTPIQAQAMPVALSGRDMLGCAETGSGKTAAFSIPMIQHCLHQSPLKSGDGPLALVLAPTRELAQQIEKEVKAFSRSTDHFKTTIIVGGTHMGDQKADLRSGVQIVVATPGRFIDHLQQGNSSLARVSYVVLDEADRMLDMGFEPQMKEIMRNLPKKHQTLLFSATMPEEIEALAQEYLTEPVRVKVGRVSSPTANVTQLLEKVADVDKLDKLLQLLVEESAAAASAGQPLPLTIVFVERKARCDEITDALLAQGLKATSLHGGRSQGERESALRDFRSSAVNILVATDVASRGLDVSGVAHVINMDLPKALEDYVHRIGRTGRAGATGKATSFHTEKDAYLVAQIRRALADVEAGNVMAFATGKAARRKEKEDAAAFREGRSGATAAVLGGSNVRVATPYKHMIAAAGADPKRVEGAADDAWDD
eukprot:TRINITY_DN350_c0_g2_i1.p1 TRINITY_DN350_c0_g2~~TRINITY_DN350_c0_g2_i1.p1  ORF type:complete len:582 (-),score=111.25 TRINITY_DN350_c0_g2_i1:1076-2821(-)